MYTGKYTRIHTPSPKVWSPRDPPLHLRAGKKELEKWLVRVPRKKGMRRRLRLVA